MKYTTNPEDIPADASEISIDIQVGEYNDDLYITMKCKLCGETAQYRLDTIDQEETEELMDETSPLIIEFVAKHSKTCLIKN